MRVNLLAPLVILHSLSRGIDSGSVLGHWKSERSVATSKTNSSYGERGIFLRPGAEILGNSTHPCNATDCSGPKDTRLKHKHRHHHRLRAATSSRLLKVRASKSVGSNDDSRATSRHDDANSTSMPQLDLNSKIINGTWTAFEHDGNRTELSSDTNLFSNGSFTGENVTVSWIHKNYIFDVDLDLELPDLSPDGNIRWTAANVQNVSFQPDEGLEESDEASSRKISSSEWSVWSSCSATCGMGSQSRFRDCGVGCIQEQVHTCRATTERCIKTRTTIVNETQTENSIRRLDALLSHENVTLKGETDRCKQWMDCKNQLLNDLTLKLKLLADCPCNYPSKIAYDGLLWSSRYKSYVKWIDVSADSYRLDVYKPTSSYCIQTLDRTTGLSAQHCCYDKFRRLITRGPGAGTPMLVSPSVSSKLHHQVDKLPWILCKGDWTRYNKIRKPNNGMNCTENPAEDDYNLLLMEAKEY